MSVILIVTWDGGGNVPPALGLARALGRRGHEVVVLGHASQRSAIEASGAAAREYRTLPLWDARAAGGSLRFVRDYLTLFTDPRFGEETRSAIRALGPDVVVVDALLPAAVRAAVESGRRSVVLVHTVLAAIEAMARGPIGVLARMKGFGFQTGFAAADALLIASPESLATVPTPPNGHYVGPVFGSDEEAPAEADPESRRVLVSLSTIHYPGMPAALQQLLDALGRADLDVVVTTGPTIEPASLRAPGRATVRREASHSELLRHVGLVIGHGGHGTATKALTAGVPVLVRPMSAQGDHLKVAAALEHAGVGRLLPWRGSTSGLSDAIQRALDDVAMHDRARALGARLRAEDGAESASELVERLAAASPGAGRRRTV